MSTIFAKVWNM